MCRRPVEYIARDRREYFYIGFCRGTMRGIIGAHIEKDKMYRQQCPSGFTHCGVGVSFLPEFCDAFLSSRHGVSSEEIARAVDALRAVPLIPDAAVILKQIGEISCTGDIGNVWIEAKTLELVAAVLDWHRRSAAAPALNKHDRAGISEAICYIEEYFSGPLTLTALAKQAAMSVSKFTAAFKIHTGISAACYVRRFRMEKAMHLLKNTPAPLRDIAGMVGYKHHSRFSTLFKEQFGIAPGEFRLNLRFSHSKALR
jgi:AraC-like DNA-binding protein